MSDISKRVRERLERADAIREAQEEPWWRQSEASHDCNEWHDARDVLSAVHEHGPISVVSILRIDRLHGRWWMHDETDSGDIIRYCPFCGIELPH